MTWAVLTKQADLPWTPHLTTKPETVSHGDRCQPLPTDDDLERWL